jgi:hypothetical protein
MTQRTQSELREKRLTPEERLQKPLTEPADILLLLGRYFASLIMGCLACTYLMQQNLTAASVYGGISLGLQFWTVLLWRRLRRERRVAEAERAALLESIAEAEQKEAVS